MKISTLLFAILIVGFTTSCNQVTPPPPSPTSKISANTISTIKPSATQNIDPSRTPRPSITVEPTATSFTLTMAPNTSFVQYGDVIVELPTVKDLEKMPSVWVEYNISDTNLLNPEEKIFDIKLSESSTSLLVPWFWCAKKEQIENNLENIDVEFLVNNESVSSSVILSFQKTNAQEGSVCNIWAIKLQPPLYSDTSVAVRYTFGKNIFDGDTSYPKGIYKLEIKMQR
jgi:hypothetical protein